MKRMKIGRRWVVWATLAGILAGALFLMAVAWRGTPVWAQTAGGEDGEVENVSVEDRVEGVDTPISGAALERASAAALTYLGEGRVSGTEVGDEEGQYEIEITRPDGSQVDVHLDEAFRVIGSEED